MAARIPDYQPGDRVPGTVYKIHRVLGAGGMGTVYDVEDTSVGRRYVLKTLHGDLAAREDLAARLEREARALAKLQHPNIVEVYTSGTTQDQKKLPFYVMERLQGQSLRTVLDRKGKLTIEQALDIAIDLLDALDHAHEFGIVHRDVKPDNIFITRGRDGRSLAKLLDFGIIKLAEGGAIQTGARFIGTFRYAPPEQILGRDVTPRSDLYAAGLVLFEMLAGRGPFDDFLGEVEIGKAQIDVPAPPLARWATVPAELDALVAAALSKRAAERPKDAYTFAQSLREMKKRVLAAIAGAEANATVDEVVSFAPRAALARQPSLRTVATEAGAGFASAPVAPSRNASGDATAGRPTVVMASGGATTPQRSATGTMMMSPGGPSQIEDPATRSARSVGNPPTLRISDGARVGAEARASAETMAAPPSPTADPSTFAPRELAASSRSGRAPIALKLALMALALALAIAATVFLAGRRPRSAEGRPAGPTKSVDDEASPANGTARAPSMGATGATEATAATAATASTVTAAPGVSSASPILGARLLADPVTVAHDASAGAARRPNSGL